MTVWTERKSQLKVDSLKYVRQELNEEYISSPKWAFEGFSRSNGWEISFKFALKASSHLQGKHSRCDKNSVKILSTFDKIPGWSCIKNWTLCFFSGIATVQKDFLWTIIKSYKEIVLNHRSIFQKTPLKIKINNATTQNLPGEQAARESSRPSESEFPKFSDPISFYSFPLLCPRLLKSPLDS